MDVYGLPYKEKLINDITLEDSKVAVSGVVVSRGEGSFLIDDGTGQIVINSENAPNFEYIRVFGNVMDFNGTIVINADIMQDLSRIDKKIYKRIKELMNK